MELIANDFQMIYTYGVIDFFLYYLGGAVLNTILLLFLVPIYSAKKGRSSQSIAVFALAVTFVDWFVMQALGGFQYVDLMNPIFDSVIALGVAYFFIRRKQKQEKSAISK